MLRMDTSQSNSAYTINDSSVGDDDVNDIIELEEEIEKGLRPVEQNAPRQRKLTSQVWSLFRKVPGDKYPDNKPRAVCNLRRHYETCAKFKKCDLVQMMLDRSDGLSTRLPKFEAHVFCELLSCAIIIHDLPFQFVEYEGIRRIWNYLCDEVPNICRNTAKADVLKMHNREKTKIRSMLEEAPSRICLTTDLWTSITTDGYLCLTAHFIDKGWNLQKKVLNFCEMPTPHIGVALAEQILSLLCEWGIEKRIFSLTVDNASSNDVCVVMLKSQLRLRNALVCDGDFFHIRCCAYIINLIVQQGLKEIEKEIEKARESVKYVKGSQVRKRKFLECVKQVSLDDKKGLRQDVPTRWNSTFLMLDSVLYYKNAFCHLQLSDSNYKNCPSEEEWGKIEKIGKFLSMFYEITCIFSGSKYPTSNLYFPKVFVTKVALDQLLCSEDVYMKTMAQKMIEKFEKYWYDFCTILAIAVILDPRYKMAFIEFAYNKAYGQNSEELKHVRDKLFSIFGEYNLITPSSSTTSVLTQMSDVGSSAGRNDNSQSTQDHGYEFDDFDNMDCSAYVRKSELELYLDEPRIDRKIDLDILSFWKGNGFRYPNLSSMARDILSIHISTVASESAFSVGGRVLDRFRSVLKPETVQAIITTRDWKFGEIDKTCS
ncbi:putative AC transposase [Citrus sinensis]|uniref:AC transposase n=1 Tax=Citrus sinensis TaxID=2711 RepID=A0ACB8L612_CITSI|nr:putative AC transposase [Citrus sinensis]